jgi:autotransporter-associated beta strand protein
VAGTADGSVYGGYADAALSAAATDNTAEIASGGSAGVRVFGGYAGSNSADATATNNTADVAGTAAGDVVGGDAYSNSADATATNNTANVAGAASGKVYGGNAESDSANATANDNAVTLTGSAATIYGGHANAGSGQVSEASNNTVTIDGGTIDGGAADGAIYGGYGETTNGAATGKATNNTVTIQDSAASQANFVGHVDVYGGFANLDPASDVFTGNTLNKLSENAAINIARNFENVNFGYTGEANIDRLVTSPGASASPGVKIDVDNNDVRFSGRITGTGSVEKLGAGKLTLTNENDYDGGTTIADGALEIGDGGTTGSIAGNIENNAKLIFNRSDAVTYADVISGSGEVEKLGAGDLTLSNANTYSGETSVSAGRLIVPETGKLDSSLVKVLGNAFFTLKGEVTKNVSIDGGGTMDVYSGSRIGGDFDASSGSTLYFWVPGSMGNEGTIMTVGGTAKVAGATVEVGIDGAASPLAAGDKIYLIAANSVTGTPANTASTATGMQGVTLLYTFDISTDATHLIASLPTNPTNPNNPGYNPGTNPDPGNPTNPDPGNPTNPGGPTVNPQTKALSEGILAATAIVNMGLDRLELLRGRKLGAFAIADAYSVKYKTGSSVDVDSFGVLAGGTGEIKTAPGDVTLTGFFVHGEGDYDTSNSFSNAASVKGRGDSEYNGIGAMGRIDFNEAGAGHYYAEASLQAGRVKTEFKARNLVSLSGISARYDSKSSYVGAHVGGGYIWKQGPGEFEVYGKYLFTRRDADKVHLASGDPIDFAAVKSHRLRIGGRYDWTTADEQVKPFVALAAEYEFDAKASAKTNGYKIDAPDMRGATGIAEFGLTIIPSKAVPLTIELGGRGYFGKREGIGGQLKAEYRF